VNNHGMAVIAARRMDPKIAWIDGREVDVTPNPGCHYIRVPRGEGHAYSWPPVGRGRGESLDSPRRIEAKQKARRAFELYFHEEYSWPEIAQKLGYASKSGPWMAVRRMITRNDFNTRRWN